MKRLLFGFVIGSLAAVLGQNSGAPDPANQATSAQAAAPSPASATADQPAAASPVPATEPLLTGYIDLGYRWVTSVAGGFDTYRSIVNLGSGPKLLGAEFTLTDPKKRLFDQLHVRAYSWGDEPYETLDIDAKKNNLYDFRADYRDIAYFNFLPSYADPLLSRGIPLDEQSFDMRRRLASISLELLPHNWIVPYVAFDHDLSQRTICSLYVVRPRAFFTTLEKPDPA